MKMISAFLRRRPAISATFALLLGLGGLAAADYTVLDSTGMTRTIFAFTCFTTKVCPASVPINSAGTEIGTVAAPLQAGSADGALVSLGTTTDAACATDNGTCTEIALLKRENQRLTTLIIGATPTDRTIASTSGASQTLMAANSTRRMLIVENTGNANCGVNPTGGPAAIGAAGTLTLAPLGSYSPRVPTLSAVTVICTAGQPVYAEEN